jgi:hypothetical protein
VRSFLVIVLLGRNGNVQRMGKRDNEGRIDAAGMRGSG